MNRELIKQFEVLQSYFRKKGDRGRSIAYTKAVAILRTIDRPITDVAQLKGVRGIGPQITSKIKEFLDTGHIRVAEEKKQELEKKEELSEKERVIQELSTVWGIGPSKATTLYTAGIKSISELKKHKSMLTEAQKIGLKYHSDLLRKIPRLKITSINVIMVYYLNKRFGRDTFRLLIAGSYRRGAEESGDIDCLISSDKFSLEDVVELFKEKDIITDVLSMRTEKFMGVAHCPANRVSPLSDSSREARGGVSTRGDSREDDFHFRLDIEFVPKDSWGSAQLYFTGSKSFNVYMRADAKRKGMLLNEHGLYNVLTGKKLLDSPTEEDIFRKVGLPYTPPERR